MIVAGGGGGGGGCGGGGSDGKPLRRFVDIKNAGGDGCGGDLEIRNRSETLKTCMINVCPYGTLGLNMSRAPWDAYPWVSGVQEGSSADLAGVRTGDTVLEINGCDVVGQRISELAKLIRNHWENGGNQIEFRVWRNKTEHNSINQQSLQKFATCLQNVAQLLECPICLEVVKPPGWQCCNGHVLCNSCRGRTTKCPVCRVTMGPRGRCLLSDKLFTLLSETFPCDIKKDDESKIPCSDYKKRTLGSTRITPPISANQNSTCPKGFKECKHVINRKIDLKSGAESGTMTAIHARRPTSAVTMATVAGTEVVAAGRGSGKIEGITGRVNTSKRGPMISSSMSSTEDCMTKMTTAPIDIFGGVKRKTYHCPTGKSCVADQDVEDGCRMFNQWDVLTHLHRVHQLSVTHYYAAFGERIQIELMNKSISCISLVVPERLPAAPTTTTTEYEGIRSTGPIMSNVSPSFPLNSGQDDCHPVNTPENCSSRNRSYAGSGGRAEERNGNGSGIGLSKSSTGQMKKREVELFFIVRIPIPSSSGVPSISNNSTSSSYSSTNSDCSSDDSGNGSDGSHVANGNERCAIFIWYCGNEDDVKKFRSVIECNRLGVKWKGCIHPMTDSWNLVQCKKEFIQLKIDVSNFLDIMIKLK